MFIAAVGVMLLPPFNFKNFKFFGGKKNAQISEFGTCTGTLFVHGSLRQEDRGQPFGRSADRRHGVRLRTL